MDAYREGLSVWVEDFLIKGVFATDGRLKVILWNRWLEEKSEIPSKKVIGKNIFEVFPEIKEKKSDRYFQQALNGQVVFLSQRFHKYLLPMPPEKDFIPYFEKMQQMVQIAPLISGWDIVGTITMIEDVTERVYKEMVLKKEAEILKKAEEDAKRERDLAQHYLNIAGVIMLILDVEGNIALINKKGCEILGYTREELLGKNWFDMFVVEKERHELNKVFQEIIKGNIELFEEYENLIRTKNGIRIIHWHNTVIRDHTGKITGTLSSGEDVTEKRRLEEAIKTMAITDELTGLYNRRGFFTLAQQQLKIAQRAGDSMLLFFLDLDNMKWINDTFGHQIGDVALKNTAEILKDTFRGSDIISRLGGDEFAVLALDAKLSDSRILINRLTDNLKKFNEHNDNGFELSLSTGYSVYNPDEPRTLDELIAEADAMMYEDKRRKRNSI